MSKSTQASKFTLVAAGTFVAAIAVGIAAQPTLQSYATHRSAEYAAMARGSSGLTKKAGYYRLALALNPGNAAYRNELASTYAKQNNMNAAANALGNTDGERVRRAGYQLSLGRYEQAKQSINALHTPTAAIVRSRIALEEGSTTNALKAVKAARNDSERLQMGFSYAAAGHFNEVRHVITGMKEGESKRRLERAQGGGVPLAQEFYKERLFHSALRVLHKTEESTEKYLLLAYVQLELPSNTNKKRLELARDNLIKGIERDPANLKLRQLLVSIYRKLDDTSGITREEQTIQKLQTGKL